MIILISYLSSYLPSLIIETNRTKTKGSQISAGFSGVTPGIVVMQATVKKYRLAILLY